MLAGEIVSEWPRLLERLAEFEQIASRRMQAEGLKARYDVADKLRERIAKETGGQVHFDPPRAVRARPGLGCRQ